jgi:ABC-2 type transport system ATP-binding protein
MSDSAVSCVKLRYQFGDHVAVDDLDLEVPTGAVFGLLGPNGAGKTTTIRLITTLLPSRPGAAYVFGYDVARRPFEVRRLVGYVPQLLSADGGLTGRENVALFARLFDVPRRQRKFRVSEALAAMGLSDVADRMASTYSGGMVRRLELAQALVNQPRLLVLDEPTIGLDPVARAALWEKVMALRAEASTTVLVTTHYMEEADQYCDQVALMHRGRIRALGTPEQLRAETGEQATLEDVFRAYTGDVLDEEEGDFRNVRQTRRTAGRLG